jgi:hypothetical protein
MKYITDLNNLNTYIIGFCFVFGFRFVVLLCCVILLIRSSTYNMMLLKHLKLFQYYYYYYYCYYGVYKNLLLGVSNVSS